MPLAARQVGSTSRGASLREVGGAHAGECRWPVAYGVTLRGRRLPWPVLLAAGRVCSASTPTVAIRLLLRLGLRCPAGPGDQVMELVTACYAKLGVGTVQVGSDGSGRQEQPVGDLGVGQPAAGEEDDLALLRGEAGERAACRRRGRHGHAAASQFRLPPPAPSPRT